MFRRPLLPACLCLLLVLAARAQTAPPGLIEHIDEAELARETGLPGYTVTEHYSIFRNGASRPDATATVETVYRRGQGKTYTVLSRTGSSLLQKYLIDRILTEQRGLSKGDERRSALITSANYAMQFERAEPFSGRDCLLLRLIPKRKSPYLMDGEIWVDAHNYHLVRVKGIPSAAPSIWVGTPEIERDYQDLDGYALAKISRSRSKRPVIGTTVVEIDYQDYRIQQ